MTPQTSFLIVAPIAPQHVAELRRRLDSMNAAPGRADPANALLPFGQFEAVHFARLFIIDDATLADAAVFGMAPPSYPLYLAFMGDVDGDDADFLRSVAERCRAGLRALFGCCEGFDAVDIGAWLLAHRVRPAAAYANWPGRTMRQVREEAALYAALEQQLADRSAAFSALSPRRLHAALRAFVDGEIAAGRLTLTPDAPTPLGRRLLDLAQLIGPALLVLLAAVLLLLASPLLLLAAIVLLLIAGIVVLVRLRQLETTDPDVGTRVTLDHTVALAALEDHGFSNQFSVIGMVKPGLVRRWTSTIVLWITGWTARNLFTRGHLARIQTIHFASWTWLDRKQRVLFCSSYDGGLDSYNDDFINKVSFGLNATFGGGIGYPRTNWLVLDGANDEQAFKNVLRRKQIPTQVWYDAQPGLTAFDRRRNAQVRAGLRTVRSDGDARAWAALL